MAKKIDWRKMRVEYARDLTASHRSLAIKYGVSPTMVSKRAAEENWTQTRKDYSEKVVQEMLQERALADAHTLGRFKDVAEKALEKLEAALNDPDHFYRYRVTANANEKKAYGFDEVERVYKTLNTKMLKEATDTAKDLLALYRDASGNPGWGTQFSALVSYLKLENEREKLALDRGRSQADEVSDELVVRFEDENGNEGTSGGFDA